MNWEERSRRTAEFISRTQLPSGAIPWFEGHHTDPWNHVESAMGLSIAGDRADAERAYEWLGRCQLDNGGWFASYDTDGQPLTNRIESNFVAYIATGVWHHYLITRDRAFLADFWPVVDKAMGYVCNLQAETGEIFWAEDLGDGVNEDALITGCASIHRSLEAAVDCARVLDRPTRHLEAARQRVGEALRSRPHRFDRTWPSKARFAMDWFYPVLCGVYGKDEGLDRLQARHEEFVHPEIGCRCVVEEPWVTIAESCELVMSYAAVGQQETARELFDLLSAYQAEDGSWWTGYQFAEKVLWPDERPTWTAAAVLLAVDALESHTDASNLFYAP